MSEGKKRTISFVKSEWNGKEILHRSDRINIKLRFNRKNPDVKQLKSMSESLCKQIKGAEIHRLSLKTGKLVLKVPEGSDIIAMVKELSKRPELVRAAPDRIGSVNVAPDDSRYSEQWALSKIHAEAAWDLETGQNDVLIAILDTGISYQGGLTHPDLDDGARYILGTDFIADDAVPEDGYGHGTHVAGTAAAETDNADGIAGMNWVSQVYICKIFDDWGNGSESDFEAAIEEVVDYAVNHNMKVVINLSAGWFDDSDDLRDGCEYVDSNGMLLCVATGNDYGSLRSPAIHSLDYDAVIAVGATDVNDEVVDFSNTGPGVTVVAPGKDILSTFPTYDVNGDTAHDFVSWEGTSMATPHVAGLASLVWSRVNQLTNDQVRDVIVNTAVKLGSGDFDESWGHGRIHASNAVAKAGWELMPVQLTLNFIDIPEGEAQLRAMRIDVKSFHATSFEVSMMPGAPFSLHNYFGPVVLGKTNDYDTPREVYIWVKYTGTSAGDTANGTAQVRCTTTGDVYDVIITANTIARPSCAMILALDKSGSMLSDSGVGSMTRQQVLVFSANIFMNYVREKNGVGIVTFDHNAYDLLNPLAGPFGPADDPFDPPRASATAALSNYSANPSGLTAIGDGLERSHNNLATVNGYDKKAIIVFTDGHETAAKYISDVTELIDSQVFAVGLGTAQQLNPNALNDICNGHGGYLLLTDQLDSDDLFKLAKYFLQIQAGLNNEQIVVDPDGYLAVGQTVKIPFLLNETDISCDAIVLMPSEGLIETGIETPQGQVISTANAGTFPTITRFSGPNISCYRMTLPVNDGASVNAHTGTWQLLLKIDPKYYKKYLSSHEDLHDQYQSLQVHGAKYCAMVHAYSNLRMNCALVQTSYVPGALVMLRCVLSEYGIPLENNAGVRADVLMPDGSSSTLVFGKVGTGVYEAKMDIRLVGICRFIVKATGFSSCNKAFTREQVLTAAVWSGGDNPPPETSDNPNTNPTQEAICKLLSCLSKTADPGFIKKLEKDGFNLDKLRACYCRDKTRLQ